MSMKRRSMCQCVYLAVSALIISIPATANTIKFNRQVFDRLQDRIEFFEHKYGPAVRGSGREREYEIGDCRFEVFTSAEGEDDKNAVIMAIRMEISAKCDVMPGYIDPPKRISKLRAKDFYGIGFQEQFVDECIVSCGNGYDPTLSFLIQLPHAAGSYTIRIETLLPDKVIETLQQGEGRTNAAGMLYDIRKYTEPFKAIIAKERLLSYQEGYDFHTAFKH